MLRGQGITTVSVTCHGLWHGFTCHRTTSLPLERLGASDDMPFLSRLGGATCWLSEVHPDLFA